MSDSSTLVELITTAVSSGFLREVDLVDLVQEVLNSLLVKANFSIFGYSSLGLCNPILERVDMHGKIGVLLRDISDSANICFNNSFSSLSAQISSLNFISVSSKSFLSLITCALLGDTSALASNVDK